MSYRSWLEDHDARYPEDAKARSARNLERLRREGKTKEKHQGEKVLAFPKPEASDEEAAKEKAA